jgi:transglutaminase-like putative cysteine protease
MQLERVAQPAPLPTGHSRRTTLSGSLTLRLAAFFCLAGFASLQYSTLVVHPPGARLLAVTAIATAGAAGLALCGRVAHSPWTARWLAAVVVALMLAAGLVAIGIPPSLLAPARWSALAHDLRGGFGALAGWLWPYRGSSDWGRLTVLGLLPPALVVSACVSFWPSPRARSARQLFSLSLLVALFVAGAANEREPASGVQGALLVALIAAWLWLPDARLGDLNRAAWWLVACSMIALAVAPVLGRSGAWIDYRSWNPVAVTTSFQWDQTYGPIRWSRSTATMLEVSETSPALLRVTSLDRFDGERFMRSGTPPASPPSGVRSAALDPQWLTEARITVRELRSNLLVSGGGVPIDARWLDGSEPRIRVRTDGTLQLGSTPTAGDAYDVVSYAPTPTPAALRRARRKFPPAYLAYTRFELPSTASSSFLASNLRGRRGIVHRERAVEASAPGRPLAADPAIARRIEASPYRDTFALARRLAGGARTPYDVVARLERFLRRNYVYDESVPLERFPLQAFLFKNRRGYCQQFSGAMTLMLRMDGIPARVAAGFKPGVYDPATQRWRVRALDAHAWVEVYFAGIGWVPFDPTPPRTVPSPASVGAGSALSSSIAPLSGGRQGLGVATVAALSPGHLRLITTRAWPLWLVLTAAAAALLALAGACWWIVGWRRLRRALAGDAAGAVEELRLALVRLGYPTSHATTLAALEAQLMHSRRAGASEYLRLLRELRYGCRDSARPTRRERRELRRALGERGSLRTRLRALLALPPGVARRFDGIER